MIENGRDMSDIPGTPDYIKKQQNKFQAELLKREQMIDDSVEKAILKEIDAETKEQMEASLKSNLEGIGAQMAVEAMKNIDETVHRRVENSLKAQPGSTGESMANNLKSRAQAKTSEPVEGTSQEVQNPVVVTTEEKQTA